MKNFFEIVTRIIYIIIGIFIGWGIYSDPPEYNKEEFKSYCESFEQGELQTLNGYDVCIARNSEASTIRVLEEKQKCDEWGGKFNIYTSYHYDYKLSLEERLDELSCIKNYTEGNKEIKETLFDYKFDITD